jgi:hypothetical protein
MNRQKCAMLVTVLAIIAAVSGVLLRMKSHQRLGRPGVKASSAGAEGGRNLEIHLPAGVLDFQSEPVETLKDVAGALPRDTSFGQRLYRAADGFETLLNVVLMGSDRTSIHKPQFCLTGSGWTIEKTESACVPVARPHAYDLPVMKLTTLREATVNGQRVTVRGIYVYWFVAEDRLTAQHWQRMWWMARDLLRTGVLQRWAYVTCFSVCQSGQEEATFSRMKAFLAAAVPEFQLTPRAGASAANPGARPNSGAL